MGSPRFALVLVGAVVAVVFAGLMWFSRGLFKAPLPGLSAAPVAESGQAPAFTLPDLGGAVVSLKDFAGKSPVVLDFWATWCGPCRAGMPALAEFRRTHQGKVEVLSINLREPANTITDFLAREGFALRVLLDAEGAVAASYGVSGIPTVVVIDPMGRIRLRIVGYDPQLEAKLDSALASL